MKGKVAIITGGASGIGRSTAIKFSESGAKVVVSDRDESMGLETCKLITDKGGEALFVLTDVADASSCKALVDQTIKVFGRLDYACNNAGIGGQAANLADYEIEEWHRLMGINLHGVFYCMKYQIPEMLKQGGGAIVNMSSILGKVGFATASAYVASKHALEGLSKTAAMEYATQGMRINTVGPAFIKTPLLSGMDEGTLGFIQTLHPMNRLGTPEEVANLVVWLCSDEASFITGNYYPVDGGYLSK
jgi:NAD(P)-dependent dehydrogenase (short-subunit alcohol dehydrogenase family)